MKLRYGYVKCKGIKDFLLEEEVCRICYIYYKTKYTQRRINILLSKLFKGKFYFYYILLGQAFVWRLPVFKLHVHIQDTNASQCKNKLFNGAHITLKTHSNASNSDQLFLLFQLLKVDSTEIIIIQKRVKVICCIMYKVLFARRLYKINCEKDVLVSDSYHQNGI